MDQKNLSRKKFIRLSALTGAALLPVVKALSKVTGVAITTKDFQPFRLTENDSMLHLEVYFIGVGDIDKKNPQIRKATGPYQESFMIIRLPQQHIAETYFFEDPGTPDPVFLTRIAGYSYLVFQIYFLPDAKRKNIDTYTNGFPLDAKNLLNWNAPYLHLVVREDRSMSETLFKKIKDPFTNAEKLLNGYPLSYQNEKDGYTLDRNFYPQYSEKEKINARLFPFTAIEAPYRLILSPELPDHRYRFVWKFSTKAKTKTDNGFELWMATLQVMRREEITDPAEIKVPKKMELPSARKNSSDKIPEKQLPMELAIIGSPDYQKEKEDGKFDPSPVATPKDPEFIDTLPTGDDRAQLVELYFISQAILTAKTEKLTFTPLGMCGTIEFKNVLFEQINRYKKRLDLFQWKHTMSFGRDQEVQVVNLVKVMVGCHPALMLHVRTTKRRTESGLSGLQYSEFLIPLEISKNLLQFDQEDSSLYNKQIYKYQHLYKSVRFATEAPKEIIPLANCHKSELVETNETALHQRTMRNMPSDEEKNNKKYLGFWAKQRNEKKEFINLEWDFIGTDWHDNEIKLTSNLYLVSSAMNCSPVTGALNIPLPDLSPIEVFKKEILKEGPVEALEILEEKYEATLEKIGTVSKDWHQVYLQSEQYLLEKTDWFRNLLEKKYIEIDTVFDTVFLNNKKWEGARDEVEEKLKAFKDEFYRGVQSKKDEVKLLMDDLKKETSEFVDAVNETKKFCTAVVYNQALPGKYLDDLLSRFTNPDALNKIRQPYDNLKAKLSELDNQLEQYLTRIPKRYGIRPLLKEKFIEVKKILCFIENVEGTCRSRIKAYNAAIGLAVYKVENGIDDLKKNIRDKLKEAAGPAIKVLEDYYHKANKEISSVKTEYFILRSSLRSMADEQGKKALDFFDNHGIRHSMVSLQGTMQKISETVHKEIPVRLAHYENYIKNQADSELLDIKNNVMQGFAKFQAESKEKIKGVMREIGHELGGLVSPELASDLVGYYHDARELTDDVIQGLQEVDASIREQKVELDKQINKFKSEFQRSFIGQGQDTVNEMMALFAGIEGNFKQQIANGKNKLVLLQNDFKEKVKNVKEQGEQVLRGAGKELEGYAQALGSKILGSIKVSHILGNIDPPKYNRTTKALYYNFITKKFKEVDIGVLKFSPTEKTRLVCYFEKSLVTANSYLSQTKLEEFKIEIFGGRLLIDFEKLEIISTASVKSKTEVSIRDVSFQKELAFLQALSKNIKVPGTGIILNITPKGVEASYTFTFPGISAGAFSLTNLQFGVGVKIPFPFGGGALRPIEAAFGINKPNDKFVVAAGIFGGRGHFVLEATPNYLKGVDCAIEFGGYLGLDLGIAKGEAYLMAGIRYVYERSPEGFSTMRFYAYITCGGSVVVFGFINISVCFIICLEYEDVDGKSSLYGTASLSLSVKIGFFEKSFTLTYSKRIMGTDSEDGGDEVYHNGITNPNREQLASGNLPDEPNGIRWADFREIEDEVAERKKQIFSDAAWVQYCKSFY